MGLTPLGGVAMGSRSGDLDPSVVTYLMSKENMNPAQIDEILNKRSGLLALSGISSDNRDVERAIAQGDERAISSLKEYDFIIAQYIAKMAVTMNGVDVITFTAGVGEKGPISRAGICSHLTFMGVLLAFNLCTQIVNAILIYYFKYVTGMESLFSVFNFCILAEMAGLMFFPKVAKKLDRPKVYTLACLLVVLGLGIIFIGGFIAPHNAVIVALGAITLKIGSAFSLGITTVSIADVIDYGELKFGTRNESIICSAQTFLMKASQAVSGLFTGVGLALVGYVPDVAQTPTAIMGIRILMIGIPTIFVALSYFIYKKYLSLIHI